MKIGPLITAVLVAVCLYAIVFERDRVFEFAGRDVAAPETTVAEPSSPAPEKASETKPVIHVVAMNSASRTVDNSVTLRGQSEADRQVEVMAETSGLVVSEPRRKGSFVSKGDVLCQVDPGTRPADLAEAQAKLAEARISDTAATRLAEGGYASETSRASASAALEAAQAAVLRAQTEIDRLTITAPFDGLLETDAAELGSLLQTGSPCATVIQLDPIKLVTFVPESVVGAIKTGAKASAVLSGRIEAEGKVTFVARSADPETRTFRVEINVDNEDLSIRDGQSASITIETEGEPAHFLPASALTLDNNGQMGVRVVDDTSTVRFLPVRLLRDTKEGVYVSGLPDQVQIIVVGQDFVSEGVKVAVTLRGEG